MSRTRTKTAAQATTTPARGNAAPRPAGHVVTSAPPAEVEPVRETLPSLAAFGIRRLSIGNPDDPAEREADEVADRVMRMPAPPTSIGADTPGRYLPIRRVCKQCEEDMQPKPMVVRRETTLDDDEIKRKSEPGATPAVTPEIASGIHSLPGRGRPLDPVDRGFFESRMGYDFSGVRVHVDAGANKLARSVEARAFTYGNNVVLGRGEYAPGTAAGRRLMAHELTHVVQSSAEAEAKQGGHGFVRQPVRKKDPGTIQREEADTSFEDQDVTATVSTYIFRKHRANLTQLGFLRWRISTISGARGVPGQTYTRPGAGNFGTEHTEGLYVAKQQDWETILLDADNDETTSKYLELFLKAAVGVRSDFEKKPGWESTTSRSSGMGDSTVRTVKLIESRFSRKIVTRPEILEFGKALYSIRTGPGPRTSNLDFKETPGGTDTEFHRLIEQFISMYQPMILNSFQEKFGREMRGTDFLGTDRLISQSPGFIETRMAYAALGGAINAGNHWMAGIRSRGNIRPFINNLNSNGVIIGKILAQKRQQLEKNMIYFQMAVDFATDLFPIADFVADVSKFWVKDEVKKYFLSIRELKFDSLVNLFREAMDLHNKNVRDPVGLTQLETIKNTFQGAIVRGGGVA